jgi:hypothetical protein
MQSSTPEIQTLRAALDGLHSRILYEPLQIEWIGYCEALFQESLAEPANRTLADRLIWMLEHGGELRAVQILHGEFTGPTLTLEQLRPRWERLDQGDLAAVHTSETAILRILRGLFRIQETK